MLNAAKNTANKNSKKKKKDATSTIQSCEPPDCTVKGIQSSPKHNPKTVATTNVTVSGQPPTSPARSSSTMCTEVTESADGQPPPQSSSTMCTQVTESADGQLPPQSSLTMCTQSAGGQPPPQSAGGQLPPQSSSTICTQSAGAQPPASPSPSKTGASLPTSPEGPHIIAYVHNLSPLKRNKRNTIDYTTLTLQTDATTTQPALCYSKTKRKLLHEHETKRAPIKISRYTKSGDKTKIVINDKTLLAKPDDMDYTFQYYDDADEPVTPLSDLLKDDASKEDNITVCAKVVKVSDPKNVVTQQSRGNKVSEVTLLDTTGTMTLDLWNEQIAQVQIDCVYRFTSLSTSYWNDSKKLSSTINTAIKQSFQPDLCSIQFKESDDTGLQNKHTIIVPVISTVEEVQRYKSCCNCKKRIIQLESIVKCSYCSHMMRASSCPTKLYVNVNVEVADQKKTLTIFDDILKGTLGELDDQSVDTIAKQLLLLENISITFNNKNVVTKMEATS
ncbi:unnamed protein product [Porites lobata]|uniref:Replication factor A C-terminal domain-containing protein n=1 Tax=Porites lobata TaxID=104759 RepID=A0ABN8NEP9_9CNID|nr:unnamed protein product [Porites lobata]